MEGTTEKFDLYPNFLELTDSELSEHQLDNIIHMDRSNIDLK